MNIGDFEIIDNDNNSCLIFERKTQSDLIKSVIDGRYND